MSSSRYQSRFVRFVAQQSMRLRDRTLQGVRQMRLALTWGTQLILYPVYVALQSTRLLGQQLEQTARQIFPKLAASIDPDQSSPESSPDATVNPQQPSLPPKSDRPVETILDLLAQLSIPVVTSPSSSSTHSNATSPQFNQAPINAALPSASTPARLTSHRSQLPNASTPQLSHSPTPQPLNSPTPQLSHSPTPHLLPPPQLPHPRHRHPFRRKTTRPR